MTTESAEIRPRTAARLCAVQALYQIEIRGGAAESTIAEFLEHRLGEPIGGIDYSNTDIAMFGRLVRGVCCNCAQLDSLIAGALTEEWKVARLNHLLRVALRAGAYELLHAPDVPLRVVINEYVDIAHGFFEGREPGLLNGILDRLGHLLRTAEQEQQGERADTP